MDVNSECNGNDGSSNSIILRVYRYEKRCIIYVEAISSCNAISPIALCFDNLDC